MARPFIIDQLPTEVRQALNAWLAEPGITATDATERLHALLEDIGHAELKPSRHAVNRYRNRMDEVGKRLQEKHAVADMWVDKFGRLPQGKMGQLIIQMVHGLAFDAGVALSEGELDDENMPGVVRMLKDLAVMLEKTERASSLNAQREREIRDQARKEAAEVAEKVAKQGGLSADSVQELRRAILGVKS